MGRTGKTRKDFAHDECARTLTHRHARNFADRFFRGNSALRKAARMIHSGHVSNGKKIPDRRPPCRKGVLLFRFSGIQPGKRADYLGVLAKIAALYNAALTGNLLVRYTVRRWHPRIPSSGYRSEDVDKTFNCLRSRKKVKGGNTWALSVVRYRRDIFRKLCRSRVSKARAHLPNKSSRRRIFLRKSLQDYSLLSLEAIVSSV